MILAIKKCFLVKWYLEQWSMSMPDLVRTRNNTVT